MERTPSWLVLAAAAFTTTAIILTIVTTTTRCTTTAEIIGTWEDADAIAEREAARDEEIIVLEKEFKALRHKAKELSDENDELSARHESLTEAIRGVRQVREAAEKSLDTLKEDQVMYLEQLKERFGEEICGNGLCS
ncbi:uncharacterized protein LOC143276104 [Babylonia areolata]|uniref:uncharacterized protein LOC143276104 n=1 Tax=Babylonia areolata TaxID=304850 RepID=UPI003FCFD96E